MTRWWVVAEPSATGADNLRESLRWHDVGHELRLAVSPGELADAVAEGIAGGFTDFVAVGGDDTANRVLNALMEQPWEAEPTLAILSASSDFIRTFALPRTVDEAAAHLVDEQRYPTDVGLIEGSFGSTYFLNAVNVGVAARAAEMSARLPARLGSLAFWVALGGFRHADVGVEADHRVLEGSALNVTIANGQFAGGGFNVAPRATVRDGVFDVQLFSGSRREAPLTLARMRRGAHLALRSVRRTKGAEITVRCPESWPIEADGEPLGHGPIRVRAVPGAILFKI